MTMTGEVFRDLLTWFMCSDPWPSDAGAHDRIERWLDAQANKRGFRDWLDAYHCFTGTSAPLPTGQVQPPLPPQPGLEHMVTCLCCRKQVMSNGSSQPTLCAECQKFQRADPLYGFKKE
jgi:hypothetical protein